MPLAIPLFSYRVWILSLKCTGKLTEKNRINGLVIIPLMIVCIIDYSIGSVLSLFIPA